MSYTIVVRGEAILAASWFLGCARVSRSVTVN